MMSVKKFGSVSIPVSPSAASVMRQKLAAVQEVIKGKENKGQEEEGVKTPKADLPVVIGGNINVIHKSTTKGNTQVKCVRKQEVKEKKTVLMTLRIKPSVRVRFESLRQFYGYSQSDFLEDLLADLEPQAVRDGWNP